MESTGIIRRIDDLGRIVIPKSVREKIFGTVEAATGSPVEFLINDGTIILKPYFYKADNED